MIASRNPAPVAPNNLSLPDHFPNANLTTGQSTTITLSNVGTEHYRCVNHATKEGVIIVVP